MEWNQIESNWPEFKNNIRMHWDKITDSQLDFINGRRDYLLRRIQTAYAMDKVEAEEQLSEWQNVQINIDGHFYQSKPVNLRQIK